MIINVTLFASNYLSDIPLSSFSKICLISLKCISLGVYSSFMSVTLFRRSSRVFKCDDCASYKLFFPSDEFRIALRNVSTCIKLRRYRSSLYFENIMSIIFKA